MTGCLTLSLLFDVCITYQFMLNLPQLNENAHPIVRNVELNKIKEYGKHFCIGNITTSTFPTSLCEGNFLSTCKHIYIYITRQNE